MTIRRTVLTGLAALLMTTAVQAQCSRTRPAPVYPRHTHYQPPASCSRTAYRPAVEPIRIAPPPVTVKFGACSHVDDLAARLEVLMNEICLDLYYNYSHNPGFEATYEEAYSLYQTARYIHASVHNFNRFEVVRQLNGADALFHHVQDDVRGWTRIHRRQIGTLGIQTKMQLAEDTLHHLMEDVGVHGTPGLEAPPVPGGVTVAPPPAGRR